MNIVLCQDAKDLGQRAAADAAARIRRAIQEQGRAHVIVATGASQFEVLAALVAAPDIDWPNVVGFHLDEYIGPADLASGLLPPLSQGAAGRSRAVSRFPLHRRRV